MRPSAYFGERFPQQAEGRKSSLQPARTAGSGWFLTCKELFLACSRQFAASISCSGLANCYLPIAICSVFKDRTSRPPGRSGFRLKVRGWYREAMANVKDYIVYVFNGLHDGVLSWFEGVCLVMWSEYRQRICSVQIFFFLRASMHAARTCCSSSYMVPESFSISSIVRGTSL